MLSYQSYYKRPVIILDGLMASGKMLTAKILHQFLGSEQWVNPLLIEHICSAYMCNSISHEDASVLIKLDIDSIQDEYRIGRRLNTKMGEASSVFSSPRVWSYLRRILTRDVLDTPPATLLLMLHGFFECIDLLDYSIPSNSFVVSQFRYPFSPAVIQQYLCWVRRWDSNSRAIQPRFKLHGIKGQDLNLPFYYYSMPDIVDDWPSLSPLEKAIKLICFQCELQISSAIKSNELNNSALIPIFFEDICFFPTQSLEYLMTSFSSLSSPSSSSIKPRNLTRFFRSSNLPRKNPDMAISTIPLLRPTLQVLPTVTSVIL